MKDFHPYFTADGSVGLYSEGFNDIFHSADGALSEAYEKFILPVDINKLLRKDSIKVLDICYGIGYNTKSFLNFIFEKFSEKKFLKKSPHAESNIDTIYTNNILEGSNRFYNDEIYTNNIFEKISVTAVDNNKFLTFLSPFVKTGEKNIKNQKIDFDYKKIEKYLAKTQSKNLPKINNLINFLIFEKIAENYPDFCSNSPADVVLSSDKYAQFFEADLRGVYSHYKIFDSKITPYLIKLLNLHNIYYKHVANCYKKRLKAYNLVDINFKLKIGDARQVIKNDNNMYNLIFLDAFTPSKCPCLWSYEFFKLLYEHLDPSGVILTYSTSAAVRGAMLEAGFEVYKNNITSGTIAIKPYPQLLTTCHCELGSESILKSQKIVPLSEYDLGLIKTRAGIFYRDENLTGQNEAILERRNSEVKNSNRMTSSEYKKSKLL